MIINKSQYYYCMYFHLKVEIKTQEQWDELLSKEGLIGKY